MGGAIPGSSWILSNQSVVLVALYVAMAALCFFMVVWILVFPGLALHDSFPSYLERVIDAVEPISPFDSDLLLKYRGQSAVRYLHFLPGAVWASVAPLQLHTKFRKWNWRLHRWLGYIFYACVPLQIAGAYLMKKRGLFISDRYDDVTPTPNRLVSSLPLFELCSALGFVYTAAMSLYHAKQGNYLDHRLCMIRHVSLGSYVALMRIVCAFFPPGLSRSAQLDLFAYAVYATFAVTTAGGEVACYIYEVNKRKKVKKH